MAIKDFHDRMSMTYECPGGESVGHHVFVVLFFKR